MNAEDTNLSNSNQETSLSLPLELGAACPSLTKTEEESLTSSDKEWLISLMVMFRAMSFETHGDVWFLAAGRAMDELQQMGISEERSRELIASILRFGRRESRKNPVSQMF
jgi:hypothetical protein